MGLVNVRNKMMGSIVVGFVTSCLLLAAFGEVSGHGLRPARQAPAPPSRSIVCYYSSWSVYRPANGHFSIEDIPIHLCTHIIYAFVGLNNRTGELLVLDADNDILKGGYRRFTALRKKNPNLKALVSVGGWIEGGRKYSEMAASPHRRRIFVTSVVDFLKRFNFDGLDLDWEFPSSPDREGSPEDKQNYVALVQDLRTAFDREGWGWMLTAVVPIMNFRVHIGYDVEKLAPLLDGIHLLTYDLRGNWTGFTDVHTPLRRRNFDLADYSTVNVVDGAALWEQLGAPREKLNIGVAFYGRTYTLAEGGNRGLHAPLRQGRSAGNAGPYTRSNGTLAYYEICELLSTGEWEQQYDEVGESSYAVNGDQWIGYDDPQSIARKVRFAKNHGFGGVVVWAVDLDDFRGTCGSKNPLLDAAHNELFPPVNNRHVAAPAPSQPRPKPSVHDARSDAAFLVHNLKHQKESDSNNNRFQLTATTARSDIDLEALQLAHQKQRLHLANRQKHIQTPLPPEPTTPAFFQPDEKPASSFQDESQAPINKFNQDNDGASVPLRRRPGPNPVLAERQKQILQGKIIRLIDETTTAKEVFVDPMHNVDVTENFQQEPVTFSDPAIGVQPPEPVAAPVQDTTQRRLVEWPKITSTPATASSEFTFPPFSPKPGRLPQRRRRIRPGGRRRTTTTTSSENPVQFNDVKETSLQENEVTSEASVPISMNPVQLRSRRPLANRLRRRKFRSTTPNSILPEDTSSISGERSARQDSNDVALTESTTGATTRKLLVKRRRKPLSRPLIRRRVSTTPASAPEGDLKEEGSELDVVVARPPDARSAVNKAQLRAKPEQPLLKNTEFSTPEELPSTNRPSLLDRVRRRQNMLKGKLDEEDGTRKTSDAAADRWDAGAGDLESLVDRDSTDNDYLPQRLRQREFGSTAKAVPMKKSQFSSKKLDKSAHKYEQINGITPKIVLNQEQSTISTSEVSDATSPISTKDGVLVFDLHPEGAFSLDDTTDASTLAMDEGTHNYFDRTDELEGAESATDVAAVIRAITDGIDIQSKSNAAASNASTNSSKEFVNSRNRRKTAPDAKADPEKSHPLFHLDEKRERSDDLEEASGKGISFLEPSSPTVPNLNVSESKSVLLSLAIPLGDQGHTPDDHHKAEYNASSYTERRRQHHSSRSQEIKRSRWSGKSFESVERDTHHKKKSGKEHKTRPNVHEDEPKWPEFAGFTVTTTKATTPPPPYKESVVGLDDRVEEDNPDPPPHKNKKVYRYQPTS